jgi:outer membrane protein assembly factor BamB
VSASGEPVVVNGVIYKQGKAFNASTGTQIWNTTVGFSGAQAGVVAVADGYVYTTGQEGLVGLNASTGSLIWSSNYGCFSLSPAILNGYIYFNGRNSAGEDFIIALNAHSGSILWRYQISYNGGWSSPAVDINQVYVRDQFGILCLDALTGEKIWNCSLETYPGNFYESSPALAYGCIYIGSAESVYGNVYALNASTGQKIWNYTLDGGIESSPAIADGAVYVAADDGYLYAFNAFLGDMLWSYRIGDPQKLHCSPAIANGRIFIGSEDTFMLALETSRTDDDAIYPTLIILFIILAIVIGFVVIINHIIKHQKHH